jgi:hypothetical protein
MRQRERLINHFAGGEDVTPTWDSPLTKMVQKSSCQGELIFFTLPNSRAVLVVFSAGFPIPTSLATSRPAPSEE